MSDALNELLKEERKEEREASAVIMISTLRKLGLSDEYILSEVQSSFKLTLDDVKRLMQG